MIIDEKNATKAEHEYREALKWARNEEHELINKLKQEGKWLEGLDSNNIYLLHL